MSLQFWSQLQLMPDHQDVKDEEWPWESELDLIFNDEDDYLYHEAQRDKKTSPPDMVIDGGSVKRIIPAVRRKRERS